MSLSPAEDTALRCTQLAMPCARCAAWVCAGYGFVSFSDAVEGAKALREMNGKYIGNRPCKLRKSTWEERTPNNAYKGKRKATDNAGSQPKKAGIFHK